MKHLGSLGEGRRRVGNGMTKIYERPLGLIISTVDLPLVWSSNLGPA